MRVPFRAKPPSTMAPSGYAPPDALADPIAAMVQSAVTAYRLLADAVLLVHVGLVVFVVGGLVVVVVGNLRGWRWVDRPWFRFAHLAAIAAVVLEAWFGIVCPLTSLETWLRVKAREAGYSGGFIEYWMHRLLYYEAPSWVFTSVYSVFGLLVAASWWYFPPTFRGRR